MILLGSCGPKNSKKSLIKNIEQTDSVTLGVNKNLFTVSIITKMEFTEGLKINFNAPFTTKTKDSSSMERVISAIDQTYSENEIELAKNELCSSPRCLTSFQAYYPTLNIFHYNILDMHTGKASFVYENPNNNFSCSQRFRGDYGIMSLDSTWVGLERQDCDNYLKIEICKFTIKNFASIYKFDLSFLDINEDEKTPMYWARSKTIYIATKQYNLDTDSYIQSYHAITFK